MSNLGPSKHTLPKDQVLSSCKFYHKKIFSIRWKDVIGGKSKGRVYGIVDLDVNIRHKVSHLVLFIRCYYLLWCWEWTTSSRGQGSKKTYSWS